MSECSDTLENNALRDSASTYRVGTAKVNLDDVLPGYKRTEAGVVPKDWAVKSVSEVAAVKTGPFGSALHESDYVEEGTPIVTVEHIGEYGLSHANLPMVADQDRVRLSRYELRDGDIVFSRVGSVDRNSLVGARENGWLFSGRLLRVRITHPGVDSKYLSYHFHSESFKQRVRDVAVGQTMASLNTKILSGVLTTIPDSIAEQRAIATALSDADALIESLDRLIAKKRAIKQAAMQQLLTGETRLPEFEDLWNGKTLGELGAFYKGYGIKREHIRDEGVPCIRYGEIYTRYDDYVYELKSRIPRQVAESAFPLKQGDLLFAGSGETAEEIGKCVAYLGEDVAYAGGDIVILRPKYGNAEYLGHLLNHSSVVAQKMRLGQGDAVVHISARSLAQVEVVLPPREEQDAIARALSDMDLEVRALERRRNKARQIKQGMMQELLTGRTRLVEPNTEAVEETPA